MSGTPRDLVAPDPWQDSLDRSRAGRPARLRACWTRARRICLGTLVALAAMPAASFADASAALRPPRPEPAAAAPAVSPYELELITGGASSHAPLLQNAFAPAATGGVAAAGTAGAQTASASRAHRATRAPGAERYVNPLPGGFAAGRTDMGVDFTARTGRPILAIGRARILGIHPNWYPPGGPNGGNLLEYKLLSGRDAGRSVYVAEQIAVTVHPGETVRAGAVIGRYAASGTGIETGWAAGGGTTLAQASTGYSEGEDTSAGRSFRRFLGGLRASLQARLARPQLAARRSPAR